MNIAKKRRTSWDDIRAAAGERDAPGSKTTQSSISAWLIRPSVVQKTTASAPPTSTNGKDEASASEASSLPYKILDEDTNVTSAEGSKPSSFHNPRALGPSIQLRPCIPADIPLLKQLNSLLLPIPYPDSFYRETLEDSTISNLTVVATWQDAATDKARVVGWLRCRLLNYDDPLPSSQKRGPSQLVQSSGENVTTRPLLYLSTLTLLSPYRSLGIATALLHAVVVRAVQLYNIDSVGAHVWTANDDARAWYAKRGFVEIGKEDKYYPRLEPQSAVVLRRRIGVGDLT